MAGYLLTTILLAATAAPVFAGKADVLAVHISPNDDGSFRIATTVRHRDTGWDHYANRWEVLGPAGKVIATRTLLHPHVHEQPFTRSLGSVRIPPGLTWIKVRAHDLVHGYGGREVTVSVPGRVH
ncbi:MAG: hypothetical protein D6720_09380 [Gammaproteobacteria bacterium]|nr:MAG: hypothetical protein D6720_09380 [Gammaproteobacteria bacterium]